MEPHTIGKWSLVTTFGTWLGTMLKVMLQRTSATQRFGPKALTNHVGHLVELGMSFSFGLIKKVLLT